MTPPPPWEPPLPLHLLWQTTPECTLTLGLVYTKANLIFHHWQLADPKFGLTFRSPAVADTFQRSMQTALAEGVQGSLSSSSSSSSNTSQEPPDVLSTQKMQPDKQSSSSSIRQEARPPGPAIVTSESSGFGLAMTSQRRHSPPQVGLPQPSLCPGYGERAWGQSQRRRAWKVCLQGHLGQGGGEVHSVPLLGLREGWGLPESPGDKRLSLKEPDIDFSYLPITSFLSFLLPMSQSSPTPEPAFLAARALNHVGLGGPGSGIQAAAPAYGRVR
ncbi:sprouty-related, EVH1 domain-containing protein 3 [Sarcophilus harrisii]|uniref:sprouty-related, EVH1 domain-containing protein 3 n=1 Tax=Sarcophilus harrisii TaxID=9305 RepID=UPI001301E75F|nr:sprouty-related, EVH1 domain-containing protein 3 [Sarcophilus harrisii]